MKPICVPCQRFFRAKKNGYFFTEMMPKFTNAEPGTSDPNSWKPYKLWCGDLWECQGCGTQIVSGVANVPIAEHFQDNFVKEVRIHNGNQLQVNDC